MPNLLSSGHPPPHLNHIEYHPLTYIDTTQSAQNLTDSSQANIPQMPRNNTANGIAPLTKPWVCYLKFCWFLSAASLTRLRFVHSLEPCYSTTFIFLPVVVVYGGCRHRTGGGTALFPKETWYELGRS